QVPVHRRQIPRPARGSRRPDEIRAHVGTGDQYRRLFGKLRDALPDLALRTTFLVGFPGETDSQFENLLRFVEEMRFDRVGVFTYSAEENTPAFDLPEAIPARVMQERKNQLMEVQQGLSLANNQRWVGRDLDIMVESRRGEDALGRSFRDAPEIDGEVLLPRCTARPGAFVRACVTDAQPYDLTATVTE
ncbi:MAG: 30S ribosomal protein S12 methylthiotransferase RimO, partial [Armatimonadota bacterium]|nr:30S ribosomal protein S12 methylthiotransferase RimO [Armatimonadota bacterium]